MKRISQNKFASSLFSCLGVAACVAFSSCGKKDNDQFKNANEFAEFLKSKANNENIDLGESNLETFAKANWKTASKKTFQFTEAIKKQIAGEDLDNEDEELHDPEQQTPKQTNPEQQKPGTEQQKPEQPNPGTEHPKPTTTDPSGTETITNESKLSEFLNKKAGKHAGIKVNGICFDLNVFFEIYSWFEGNKGGSSQNLISSAELKLGEAIKMLEKCKKTVCAEFGKGTGDQKNVDVNFVKQKGGQEWESKTVYYFSASDIELEDYNNLLYLLLNGKNLGFSNLDLSKNENVGHTVNMKDAYEALVNLQKN